MIINRVVAVTHMPSFQHWKIQPQSLCLCLTFYLCLYLYFSSWAVDVAHVTESPALANTESGRCFSCFCLYLWFSFPRYVDRWRGSCLWFPALAGLHNLWQRESSASCEGLSVGNYRPWALCVFVVFFIFFFCLGSRRGSCHWSGLRFRVLANTDGGRVFFYVFLFVFVDFYSLVRGQWTWLMSLVSSVGKYAEWSLGIDESWEARLSFNQSESLFEDSPWEVHNGRELILIPRFSD